MTILRLMLLSAAVSAVSLSNGHAAPCPSQADALAAKPALGPSAPQSVAAQMHRQPTAASVAAAEKGAAAHAVARGTDCPALERHGEPAHGDHDAK
jgi:hypothetical protein